MKQVMFLCSANFYRSRFAEHLFNHLAAAAGLPWRAHSCGLRVGFWGDVGPISHYTVDALKARGVPVDEHPRQPKPLTLSDLVNSELVVAVKEVEHRAMVSEQFLEWADAVEYWDVDDLDCATPDIALPYLEEKVRQLVARLQETGATSQAEVA
ncbi:MAG: arsenate-mycothiol transferase ArsC [Pirellulaceae bacterium]